MNKCVLALSCALMLSPAAMAKDIYVDGKSGNDNNTGAKTSPYKTGSRALSAAAAGDIIHFLPTAVYPYLGINKSGSSSAPITITGDGVSPNLTQFSGGGKNFGLQVYGGAKYVTIQNLDIQAPGTWYGVNVQSSSHIALNGNRIHNAGNGGIGTTHSDYLSINHNVVYGTAQSTGNNIFGSGISLYECDNTDSSTGIKNIINGNIVYANTNTPNGGTDSDGNGIIIDDSRHTQSDNKVYNGKTLIQNNVVYGNGGRGIYTYESDHVTITNNSLFENNRDSYEASWRPGEIDVDAGGGDITIYNNVIYGDASSGTSNTGAHVGISVQRATDKVGSVAADYNLMYNPSNNAGLMYYGGTDSGHTNSNSVSFGSHNNWADPQYTAPSTTSATANFQLKSSSPGMSGALSSMAASVDLLGVTRSGSIEFGAYQQSASPVCGSANGVSVASKPAASLCSIGTASSVGGSGPWTWSCANSGKTVSCSAPLQTSGTTATTKVNGACGSYNGASLTIKPAANLCATGTTSAIGGTGPWTWSCAGQNGGSNASCSAKVKTPLTISVTVSGDASPYMGLLVNGQFLAGVTVTASHAGNQWQTLNFVAPLKVGVTGIAVGLGGTITGAQHLYIKSVTANGKTVTPAQGTFYSSSTGTIPSPTPITTFGSITWAGTYFGP